MTLEGEDEIVPLGHSLFVREDQDKPADHGRRLSLHHLYDAIRHIENHVHAGSGLFHAHRFHPVRIRRRRHWRNHRFAKVSWLVIARNRLQSGDLVFFAAAQSRSVSSRQAPSTWFRLNLKLFHNDSNTPTSFSSSPKCRFPTGQSYRCQWLYCHWTQHIGKSDVASPYERVSHALIKWCHSVWYGCRIRTSTLSSLAATFASLATYSASHWRWFCGRHLRPLAKHHCQLCDQLGPPISTRQHWMVCHQRPTMFKFFDSMGQPLSLSRYGRVIAAGCASGRPQRLAPTKIPMACVLLIFGTIWFTSRNAPQC